MKRIIGAAGLVLGMMVMPARAEIHVLAGGGVHIPNGDSARFYENGYRLGAGIEWKPAPNLGLLLEGAYNRDKVNGDEVRESRGFPSSVLVDGYAHVYELNLSPKFYLLDTENIGAFIIAGAGPRWFRRKTTITPPSPGSATVVEKNETSLGVQFGFGVEAAFPGGLRLGIGPTYHIAFAKSRVQYAAVTAYLKL